MIGAKRPARKSPRAKVLIVDDQPESIFALETVLAGLDVEIVRADSGYEALSALIREEFAVVLLDVNMPGMDGFETASLIRANEATRFLPIIFITGEILGESSIFKGYESGAVDYLLKPITPVILKSKVKVFVDLFLQQKALDLMAELEAEVIERRKAQAISVRIEGILRAVAFAAESFLGPGSYEDKVPTVLEELGVATTASRVYVVEGPGAGSESRGVTLRCEWAGAGFRPLADGPGFETRMSRLFHGEWEVPLKEGVILAGTVAGQGPDLQALLPEEGAFESLVTPVFVEKTLWGCLGLVGRGGEVASSEGELQALRAAAATLGSAIERDRAVERHVHSEKMSALGAMAAGVAHELNNPMMGILNFAQYCRKHTDEDSRTYPILSDIERETERCADIVQNLLLFARRGMPGAHDVLVPGSLRDLSDRVLKILSYRIEKENVALTIRFQPDIPDIPMNADKLQQVILNLIGNALDALAESEVKEISLGAARRASHVTFTVRDSGSGIDPDDLRRIFDPFFSTKPPGKGSGLGLPICRRIVEDHAGKITCDSRPGQGTRFEIHLPLEARGEADEPG